MSKRIVVFLGVVLVLWLGSRVLVEAHGSAGTPPPPTMTPSMAVEVRQPQQPPQSFWEQYGVIALVISGMIGGILTLVFANLLGPTFQHWGELLRERLKGEAGRFLERYVPALAEEHRYLKLVGIYGKEWITRPPLKEVYVSLHVGSAAAGDGAAIDRSLTVAQAMTQHDRLLVLGEPGAGKSTLLDWLVLVFCGEIEQRSLQPLGDLLPIYLPLRACAADDRSLYELMADPALLPLSHAPPVALFRDRLDRGGCLVLLDGLDEVVDHQARDRAADKINRLVRAFPKNRYVVTCRTAGWEEGLLTGEFARLLIRDFSEGDTHRFIAGWYRAVRSQEVSGRIGLSEEGHERALVEAQRRAASEAQALMDAIAGNLSLSELARNPLILSLIALVHYRRRDLPQGRTKLYQECLEILLDVWDREDKELDLKALSLNAKETILRRIAHHFHRQGLTEAGGEELERLIEPLLPELDCTLGPAEALRQIEERSGILVARALNRYTFAHRTLQEYLTAKVLAASQNRYYELLSHLRDEPWREVILLYVGLVEDATPLVQAILQQPDDEQCNQLFLAGQCLVEDVRVEEAVRAEAVSRLESGFRETADALTLERLGRTLAAIGGGDVVALFGQVLKEGAPPQQASAARALGRLGAGSKDRDPVARLLAESLASAQPAVRRAAALALADLGHEGETTLAALERARQDKAEEVRAAALWSLLELGQAERLGFVRVPAGEFDMGSTENDPLASNDEKPQHRLYLEAFYIARHPVTNARFARFVEATGYKARHDWDRYATRGREDHPVVNVDWYDARAYAAWLGVHLPSEAQWEKAAGWDADLGAKRRWPWGDSFDQRLCNSKESRAGAGRLLGTLRGILPWQRNLVPTTPVGSFSPGGDSACAAADMAGNVWEWCSTAYASYPYDADDGREEKEERVSRVLRGGAWWSDKDDVRCACRYGGDPDDAGIDSGFRVARGPLK